jgi:hypothetical protein
LATVAITAAELRELNLQVPVAPLSLAMPPTSGVFKVAEDAKAVQIDAVDLTKTVQIRASLDLK